MKKGATSGEESISKKLVKGGINLQRKGLNEWKIALAIASDPENSDFTQLEDLYQNLMLDAHLRSCIDSRILKIQQSKFKIVNSAGEENEDLSKLFEAKWHADFIRLALLTIFKGSSVVEMWELDASMQLKKVEAINKKNLNLKKKLILKNAGDTTGWNFEDPQFTNYYLQIGENEDLGMLADLAPVLLAKKLAVGSWLDFVEKFGIPARWAKTDREDKGRQEELFDMMMAMVSNHVAVLKGNETIFTEATPNTDAYKVFNELIERMNSEISKRILGATGTTDEKAFVGAAQVHQDVANDRHESDRFFIKNLINNVLIPKLALISPIYSSLVDHTFIWDSTEDMSKEALIESVAKLTGFEFDAAKLAEMTGLPIIAKIIPEPTETKPAGGVDVKK